MKPWALVTGGAKRIGRAIAINLHHGGYNVIVHYGNSAEDAHKLCDELNNIRNHSSVVVQADLSTEVGITDLFKFTNEYKLEVLINNASSFYPTPMGKASYSESQSLLTVNLLAPYLLSQLLSPTLSSNNGVIINLLDIHGQKPLKDHGLYSISKAALQMATLSLAQEMGPSVRVNGVAPGAILWPKNSQGSLQDSIINEIPLAKCGSIEDIAKTVSFLINSDYITGQIITVDGGRTAVGYQGA